MKDLPKQYKYHLGRALDCAALIGASKQEICNDVIIMSAAHIIGYKERRYQAPRQGGGASSPRENRAIRNLRLKKPMKTRFFDCKIWLKI